ncbi:MAG: hypothetical protein H7X88_05810 [Gloeobacteraceae cyanobacterium ES-bin-316]|nr:hypothetical protein [Ferruginibacter sp.]
MKRIILICFTSSCVFLFSCKKETTKNSDNINVGTCKDLTLKNQLVRVCLDSVVNDSRCPADVQCIFAGVAVAKFTVSVSGNILPVTLSLPYFKMPGYPSDTVFNGFKFEFLTLDPYPGTVPSDYSDYKAAVKVTPL